MTKASYLEETSKHTITMRRVDQQQAHHTSTKIGDYLRTKSTARMARRSRRGAGFKITVKNSSPRPCWTRSSGR